MASNTEQYQKLYEQALEAQKKYNKTKNKKSSNNPNSLLGQKTTSIPTTKETPVKSNTEKKRVISNIKVAQPDYDFFNKQKSQTDTILEKGKKALADREKAFNEWYTEDKKDLLYNFDGSYRDLRTELETFKANSNILNMTPKELKAYTTYKNELETAIDHSDYLQQRDKEKTLSNLEEQKKFYLMQDAYNDTFGEKAAMKIGKVGAGILNMPFQVADVVNDFVNPNFDMSDPKNISNQLTSAMNEGEEQIQFNSNGAEQFALNTIEGVADFGAHFLMSMVTGVSPIVTMGAKSGLNKYAQNRQEGYDEATSLGNAVLSGTLTALTEKIGVDNFTNIITSPLGQFSIGALISQSLSEGAEEGIEYLAEPIIDFATLGKNVDYNSGELFMSVALGMSSGAVLGAMGNGVSAVKTRKAANRLKADMQVLQDYANKNDLSEQETIAINDALVLGNKVLADFESKSVVKDAVTFKSDEVNPRSVEEIRQNMYKFMQPQVDAETKTYRERSAMNNIIYNAQQTLADKGIRMDALQYSNLDEDIKKQVDTVQKLANDLKQDVIFNSELFTDKGEVIDGYYDNNTGRIVINPKGNNPALTTFVHEMTHGIESSKWYDSLKQLIIDSDSNFENGVKNIKEAYKIVTELDNEGATKEYVANKTQFMLGNEDFVERLVSYNNSLARRIYEGIKHISTNTSTLQNIEYNFMKAFKNNGLTEDGSFFGEKDLVTVDENNESAAPQFSLSTWTKTNKQRIINDIVTKGIADEVTAQKWVDDVSGVAKQIADNKELLDYEANPYYSMKKKNSEYKYTIDVSTNCKKRLALAETIDAIQKALPNTVLTGEDYIRIRQMMAKKYEVSCGFCYVESRRKDLGKVAEMFIEQYNDPSLTIYDLVTDEGVTKLRANKPEVYKAFEKFNNRRGSGKVKLVESRTEYRGEIMRMQKGAINYLNKTGGLRLQSFSDFETPHLIDMMQVVLDMSRKGLTSQAYTKIPNFADAFGKTGIKINLSLVTYGINENGELVFDDKEGMPHKQAFALRKKYSDNVGTILVGKDDASILAAMKDERIDFIIPYHRSGWAGKEYEALGITGYKDYTPYQKEYWIEPKTITRRNGKVETETAPKKAIYPLDYWDFSKSGKENAETYLKLCAKQGKRPKFYNFLQDNGDGSWSLQPDGSTDGYWKTLIDFKMYNNDGVGAPQQPVMPIFDTEVNNRILAEYDGSHLGGNVKHDIVNKFLKEKKQGNKQFSIGLSADLQGSSLTNEQTEYFKDSKARDEDGNLKVLYHGSTSAPFYEFDRNKAFIESDWGKGFYASDTYDDVANNYEGGGPDYENKVARLAEQIEAEEGIDYEEAEERAREQLGTDEYLIEAYGKFDNPAIVGETYVLNQEDYLDNYDIDDFEDEDEYYYAVEEIMSDTIDDAMQEVYNNLDFYNYDDYEKIKGVLYEVMSEGGTDILDLKERINNLYLETDEGLAGNEATRLILKGLGYDGIIDNSVSSRFNMGLDKNTTHYIAFDSSQYKNTDNYTPTTNRDIRYSIGLTKDSLNRPNKHQKRYQELHEQMVELDLIDDMESLEDYLEKYYTKKHRPVRYDENLNELLDYGFDEDLLDEFKWNENYYYEDDIEYYKNEARKLEKRYEALEKPLETDNAGKQLSKEQKEFFKNVNIYSRDKEGYLKRFYHGTPEGGFYTFELGEKRHGRALGDGFYFSDSKGLASEYLGKSNDSKLYEVYLKMENTLSADTYNGELQDKALDIIHKYYSPNIDENHPYYYYVLEKLYSVPGVIDYFKGLAEFNKIPFGDLMKEYGYDSVNSYNEFVVFDSEQIKDIYNTNPTANKDIRYSIGLSQQDIEGKTVQNTTKKENSAISNLKSKYSDLDPTLVDKALDEVKKNGFVTESTKGALKDDLMQFFGDASILEGNPKARNRVNDFITETVEQFATKGQYESDMKFVNSVASKASKLLNGYAGITEEDINKLYDEVSTIKKADALLKEGRDLAALNYTDVINDLLFKGKDAKGYMSQIERVLDKVGNGDPELRTKLREVLEFPRYQAQIQYVKCLKKYNETIDKIVKSGIREGSKESKAVQYVLEKHREDGSEYTNADLLKDFNYKMKNGKYAYENIEEAAKLLRKDYDDIFRTIDEIRTSIYGDVELKNDLDTKELQAKFEVAKTKVEKTKEALKKNPTEQTQKVYNAALNEYKLIARQLSTKLDEDASGDSTRRQKLEYRENYAHHTFKKESILMKSLRDRGGVKEVPTKLAGVSDFAQPKSGYAGFFKKRTGGSYEADALKGFAEYIQDASRIIAYDPLIEYYRDFTSILRHSAQDDTMSQFTRYLTNYTNALAGKTNSLDRPVRELMGDTLFGAFKEINSRVKANAILGNLKTSVTQLANAPLAAGILVKNGGAGAVQDFTKGGFNYLTSLMGGKKDKSDTSPFIQARYFDTDTDAMGIGAKVDDMFNFLLTKGDEVVTKMVWNAAYEQAVRKGVDSPVFYADDLTRRTVAGRSHGEVPVALQSQVMNFVIPFQVETTNIFNNIKDMVTDPKAWPSLLVVLLGNFFFDELYEKITGSRIQFDPIHTIRESIKNEENIATASKHLLGETLSNMPGGNLIPTVMGMDSEETEEFFGDSDPTRYGTGNIGLSAIADAGTSLAEGKPLDAASDLLANFALPGGGKQIQRSVEALQANGILPQYVNGEWVISPTHYTKSGKEGYTTDPSAILDNASNLGNFAKQVAFGKWAGREAQEYLDGFGKGSTTQKESKAQDIINWFTSKDENVTEDDAVAISEEIKQAQENLTSSNPKGEFIEWMNNTEYTSDEKNMIFDTYYGDGKQVKNINNFATESNLTSKEAYQVKRAVFTSEGKKAANKVDTIRNSKALEVRKKLDELGLYDEYVNYVLENDLDLSSMGLNKKVMKMTNEEFESEYKGIFGSSYKAKTDEELLNAAYSQAIKSSGSSKKNATSSSAKKLASQKKKIDNIINAARTSSVGSNDNRVDEILSKLKNKTASGVTSSNSELLKKYLKEHAYDAALLG